MWQKYPRLRKGEKDCDWPEDPSSVPEHQWPLDYLAYDSSGQWVEPFARTYGAFQDKVNAAVRISMKTGKVDWKLRDEFFTKTQVWLWHPVDR